jgi:hypothetical protein
VLEADLALTNMGLGDKAAAFKLIERGIAVVPIEKDAMDGPTPIAVLARIAAQRRAAYSRAAPARSDV